MRDTRAEEMVQDDLDFLAVRPQTTLQDKLLWPEGSSSPFDCPFLVNEFTPVLLPLGNVLLPVGSAQRLQRVYLAANSVALWIGTFPHLDWVDLVDNCIPQR